MAARAGAPVAAQPEELPADSWKEGRRQQVSALA